MTRIGLFGGTFDPVHRGHMLLAEGAMRILGLKELIWIPTHYPPHKESHGASAEDRAAMVELAIAGFGGFSLSRVELDRPAPSYTIDTVRQLQAERSEPNLEWFFLVGSDNAPELPQWKEPEELMKRIKFITVSRPGGQPDPVLPLGVTQIPVQTIEVSSSEIRDRVRQNKPIRNLVPEPVERYIKEKGLYR